MALLSSKEMSALCGITPKNLATYKSRKKVIGKKDSRTGLLLYDTTQPVNVEFIEVRKTFMKLNGRPVGIPEPGAQSEKKLILKPIAKKKTATKKERKARIKTEAENLAVKQGADALGVIINEMKTPARPTPAKRKPRAERDKEDREEEEATSQFNLDQRKKQLEVEKLAEQVEIERMKKEKMQGEVIPSDLVRLLFSQHFKNMALKFKEEAEKITGVMVTALGGKKQDKIDILKRLEDSINTAINEAEAMTEFDLDSIVDEYSNSRSRGERK